MSMKYVYETLDISGCSIPEAILALQTWQAENPDAVDSCFSVCYDGDSGYTEVSFMRPMSEQEIEAKKAQQAQYAIYQEQAERAQYERLKEKFEGN